MKPPSPKDIKIWIDERIPLLKFFTEFLHEDIPGGARYSYTLGSACMFLLTIQIVTGIWQLFYYVPSTDYAYSSLNYLRLQVPWGWLIHGLHYWGGNAFSVVVGLHMMRVFIWGSYKKPRELVWLFGLVLLLMTVLFMFTGPVLAWNKEGYWAGQVGLGIAGSVPIVGPFTQLLLQGASNMGQSALLRMYVMHVALIPFLTGLFVFLHLMAFRQFGEAGPWKEEKRKKIGTFWPEQIFKDIVVAFLLFILLVGLTAFFPQGFSGLADPSDTLYTPKPIWNFLFLYQILKWLPGPLEALGTVGVPTLILLAFASLPFLDKNPERNPFKRGILIITFFVFIGVVLYLTWLGYIYKSDAEKAHTETSEPVKFNGGQMMTTPADLERKEAIAKANEDKKITGEKLFKTLGCAECHGVTGGVSNKIGPDLALSKSNNRSREWMHVQIIAPQEHNLNTIMPPYSHLSPRNVDLLIAYLESLKPKEVPAPIAPAFVVEGGSAEYTLKANQIYGEQLFNSQGCTQCHTLVGRKTNKAGPDLIMATKDRKPTKEWLKAQLITPQAHNPLSIMPSYAGRLQDKQIDSVVDFLKSLEKREVVPLAVGEQEVAADPQGVAKPMFGASVNIVGNSEHGAVLFHQSCTMCHGPHGNTKTPGFNALKGVPTLNPIRQELFNSDSTTFIQKIDIFIQHGAPALVEGGPAMPNFGDTNTLTQAQIADIESYILTLNGVDRTKIINPGVDPKEFFFILINTTLVIVLLSALYWFVLKFLKI